MRSSVLELGLGGGVPIPNLDGRDARPPFDCQGSVLSFRQCSLSEIISSLRR